MASPSLITGRRFMADPQAAERLSEAEQWLYDQMEWIPPGAADRVRVVLAELAITKNRHKFLERWIESHGQDVPTEDSP